MLICRCPPTRTQTEGCDGASEVIPFKFAWSPQALRCNGLPYTRLRLARCVHTQTPNQ